MPIIRDQEQRELKFSTFRVNEGVDTKASNVGRISEVADNLPIFSAEDYANYWTTITKGGGVSLNSILKASGINVPPSVQGFASMSYMPNAQVSQFGILQWPGLPPQTLEKLAREHVGPQLIIGARQDDVLRYSELSTHPWRPGWQIVPRDNIPTTDSIRRDIREAELFIINSGNGKYTDARWRDSLYRVNFPKFLAEIVRNSLTFDGIAIWTDTNSKGEVISYAPMPAQNIRLRARPTKNDATTGSTYHQGEINFYGQPMPDDNARVTFYNGPTNVKKVPNEDEIFAVAVDESGNIIQKFTRNDLIWYTRNPRVDVSAGNYGLSELETALTLITGFTNAIQFNANLFNENSIPKAILTIKGNYCYSADTEVLTKRGWMTFDKVDIGTDEFATLNKTNSNFEWQKASEKVWEPYSGKMYSITGRSLDLLVTPNHNMVLQHKTSSRTDKKSNEYITIEAENLYNSLNKKNSNWIKKSKLFNDNTKYSEYWQIPVTASWQGEEISPITFSPQAKFGGQSVTITGDDYCAFMGMYLSEGSVTHSYDKIEGAAISQNKNSKGWSVYNDLLTKIWGKTPYYNGRQFLIYNAELGRHLTKFGADSTTKCIPEEIMNASPKQLQIFFDYYTLGDGYTVKRPTQGLKKSGRLNGIHYQITTSSKKIRDQFQELAIKLGYSAGYSTVLARKQCKFPVATKPIAVGQDFIYEKYTEYAYYDTHKYYQISLIGGSTHPFLMEPIQYDGYIGCVTVPNHTLLVRQNGATSFCGNTQKQFDSLSRVWDNLQRGPNTSWTLPAIQLSEKGAIELISLEPLRKESVYYSNLVNMFMGALATVYRYPVHRLGYKISGTTRDMRPDTAKDLDVDDDIGLPVLLTHLEIIMNDYILWTKWPHLKFWFTGKSPKENARLYEAQMLSLSLDERRLLVGMPRLVETVTSPAAKEIAEIMGLAPTDSGLTGIYQSILAAKAKGVDLLAVGEENGAGDKKDIEQPGARFPSKVDPGISEEQGHMSGVRRDSKAEKESAGNDSNGRPKTPPNLRLKDFTDYGNK